MNDKPCDHQWKVTDCDEHWDMIVCQKCGERDIVPCNFDDEYQ